MLRAMETTPPITTAYEPCGEFIADNDTPVCAECGWLEIEHKPAPSRKLAA
jgi:hypothetical protein